jgi:small subunit ribosomal protein S4e
MRYLRKLAMPRSWPIAKKTGATYIGSPIGKEKSESMLLTVVLRDMLKIAGTKKEIKKILRNKEILINGKVIYNEKYPVGLLDVLSIKKLNKYYKLILENARLKLIEIPEKESWEKVLKIIGKKQISQKETQINLYGGKNAIYSGKVSTNDSVLLDLKQNKIIKIIPLKENSKILVMFGKHSGKIGEIKKIIRHEKTQEVLVKTKDEEIKIPIKNILVVD